MKVLQFSPDELQATPAWTHLCSLPDEEAGMLLKSKVLAFSRSTWSRHISSLRKFQSFCRIRGVNPLSCVPSLFNTFLLSMGQNGSSFGAIKSVVEALNFVYRFFLIRDSISDVSVNTVLRFLQKACPTVTNVKKPFGAREVRRLWDGIDKKYDHISQIPLPELRTFVMTVVQHASFCRFSDLAPLKLSDIFFELDYFKLKIRCSKTDQAAVGQWAYVSASSSGIRSPHNLMCLFLHYVHTDQSDDIYLFPPMK